MNGSADSGLVCTKVNSRKRVIHADVAVIPDSTFYDKLLLRYVSYCQQIAGHAIQRLEYGLNAFY
jgi:hypothetical protein